MPPEWTPEKQDTQGWDPILYIHGLGFGLVSVRSQAPSTPRAHHLMPACLSRQIQNIHVLQSLVHHLPHNPLIVPIQPHISMHIFHPRHLKPPTRAETTSAVRAICARWDFTPVERLSRESLAQHDARSGGDTARGRGRRGRRRGGIAVLSHSNGSIAHGWLIKDCPEIILRSALVDPVVFCLWEGGESGLCATKRE